MGFIGNVEYQMKIYVDKADIIKSKVLNIENKVSDDITLNTSIKTSLEDYNSSLVDVLGVISDIYEKIEDSSCDVDDVKDKLDSIKTKLDTMHSESNSLPSDVDDINTRYNSLKTEVENIKTSIGKWIKDSSNIFSLTVGLLKKAKEQGCK
jgi:predicted nuclease with TOPRIM domain